jgi:hypothetical protein
MTKQSPPPEAGAGEEAVGRDCLRCGTVIESMGVQEFRTGGTSGGIKLLIGEWGELGERKLPFELLVCPLCRYAEFRAAW